MSAGTVQRAFELAPECRTIDELRSKLINERCANIDAHLKDSPARSEQAVEASGLRSASKGFERLTHVSSWNLIAPRRLGDLPVIPCRHLGRSCVRGRPLWKVGRDAIGGHMPRELIDTGTDKRYVRRDKQGQFKESDDVGRSSASDQRRDSKTKPKPGEGDRGDR